MSKQRHDEALKRVTSLIVSHGKRMKPRQLDRALYIWDTLVKASTVYITEKGGTRFMKSEDHKPVVRAAVGGNPVIDRTRAFTQQFSPYTNPQTCAPWNGYQLAAIKAGLDPDTPNLERMTYDEMCELAQKKLKESVKPLQRAAGLHYCTD